MGLLDFNADASSSSSSSTSKRQIKRATQNDKLNDKSKLRVRVPRINSSWSQRVPQRPTLHVYPAAGTKEHLSVLSSIYTQQLKPKRNSPSIYTQQLKRKTPAASWPPQHHRVGIARSKVFIVVIRRVIEFSQAISSQAQDVSQMISGSLEVSKAFSSFLGFLVLLSAR